MGLKKGTKYTARRLGVSAALTGAAAKVGAAANVAANKFTEATTMKHIPDVYGQGRGMDVPTVTQVATDAAHQAVNAGQGALVASLLTAGAIYGAHRHLSKSQQGTK